MRAVIRLLCVSLSYIVAHWVYNALSSTSPITNTQVSVFSSFIFLLTLVCLLIGTEGRSK